MRTEANFNSYNLHTTLSVQIFTDYCKIIHSSIHLINRRPVFYPSKIHSFIYQHIHSFCDRLNDNYYIEDGISLPRSSLYTHYLDFCTKNQIVPVNAASFGKVKHPSTVGNFPEFPDFR